MKEPSRFLPFLPDFPPFPRFFLIFPSFSRFLAIFLLSGVALCPPLPPPPSGYATALALVIIYKTPLLCVVGILWKTVIVYII